jgi:glutamate-5-semialdehyde dehydrogenase
MNLNEFRKKIIAAKSASLTLLQLDKAKKRKIFLDLAAALESKSAQIIKANARDIRAAKKAQKDSSFIERLSLDEAKIKEMAKSVRQVAAFKEILFEILETRKRPSGITVKKVRVPLGLVAIIYESRPNVTIDAFILSFKSGNAVLLKGGKEIKETNKVLISIIQRILAKAKIDQNIVQDFSGINRTLLVELLGNDNIDCLIPRGGKKLINFVRDQARIPIIITGASVVHTYVDEDANLELARRVVVNAKTRRVSICNALDVLLIHKNKYQALLKLLASDLAAKKVSILADTRSYAVLKKLKYPNLKKAQSQDFDTEFLDYIVAIKVVNSFTNALKHIQQHSLGHSEAIITRSKKKAETFFQIIDAGCLYWNTSTQFGDGGEYGLGAEIGISTQKLHARGPFAHEALTTYKYLVTSKGVIRK